MQVQEVRLVLAITENVLTGQDKQVLLLVACNDVEYVSTVQLRHDSLPVTSL
jgi:hypothetical protein